MDREPRICVGLMTRDRPHYLRLAMESILAQKGVDLELLVLDNASSDGTPDVVQSFDDPRVVCLRSETDIGIMRNWNRAIDEAKHRAPFVSIFHDDDLMLPGFLAESVQALMGSPTAGVCLSLTEFIDSSSTIQETLDPHDVKPGLNQSLDFIELIVRQRAPLIYPCTGVFRSDVLARIGPADSPHTRATCDMNHWHRAIMDSDVYFLCKVLSQYRLHEESDTHTIHQTAKALGWYGVMVEHGDLLAHLLRSSRARDLQYRQWIADRLLALHVSQSDSLHQITGEIYHTFENRIELFFDWLERILPPEQPFILADEAQLGVAGVVNGRQIIPILERDGKYWGHPNDAQHAIDELERLRETGINWIVFAWPCRWWFDAYGDFERHLTKKYGPAIRFPHGVIFDLRDRSQGAPPA